MKAKSIFLVLAASAAMGLGTAHAGNVFWSLGLGQPGVQVVVGNVPQPVYAPAPVYYGAPVYEPAPVYYPAPQVVVPAPTYYRQPVYAPVVRAEWVRRGDGDRHEWREHEWREHQRFERGDGFGRGGWDRH